MVYLMMEREMKRIKNWLNACKFTRFKFGEQEVSQFILFECKYLFSIIFFYFHKSEGTQDRFHTHAFNGLTFRIFGDYDEELLDKRFNISSHARSRNRILYIPRDSYHRITRSKGCLTMLLAGRWKKTWKEYFPNTAREVEYTWNRQKE